MRGVLFAVCGSQMGCPCRADRGKPCPYDYGEIMRQGWFRQVWLRASLMGSLGASGECGQGLRDQLHMNQNGPCPCQHLQGERWSGWLLEERLHVGRSFLGGCGKGWLFAYVPYVGWLLPDGHRLSRPHRERRWHDH